MVKCLSDKKHCMVCNTLSLRAFTTVGSSNGGNSFVFHCSDCEVNSPNTAFTLQSDPPGMCP